MALASIVEYLGQIPVIAPSLRALARRYPDGSVVTIRTGLAKGCKWRRYHRYVNGYWIGHYELEIQNALRRELKPGDTFFDIGANAGFFTLVASQLVGPIGKCVAFDPSPDNVKSIAQQIQLNELERCSVDSSAISDFEGEADFCFGSPGSPQGHLGSRKGDENSSRVKVTTLDNAIIKHGPPDFIKLDVEGEEARVLLGANHALSSVRPRWLIELHGPESAVQVRDRLREAHYHLYDLNGCSLTNKCQLPHHVIARPS